MARILGVTVRALWNWEHQAAASASESTRGRGRPPVSIEVRRKALFSVRREMRRQGKSVGEEAVLADLRALGIATSRRLVREQLAVWKRYDRRRAALRRERNARSIRPTGVGLMWSLDGAWIGRMIGRTVRAEIVLDVASLRTLSTVVAFTATAHEVIELLERAVVENGGPPVVLFFDNGPENVNVLVVAWCREHGVMIVRNVPHTPQHNPWAEHRIGELKIESGLDAHVSVPSLLAAQMELERAVRVLDHGRRRRTLEFRTACEADKAPHPRYDAAQREALLARVDMVVAQARSSLAEPASARALRRAERNARLKVLEESGVITITVGGQRSRTRTHAAHAASEVTRFDSASIEAATPLRGTATIDGQLPPARRHSESDTDPWLGPVTVPNAVQGDLVSRIPTAGPAGTLDTKRTRSETLDALREIGSPREESCARTSRGSVLAPTPDPAPFRFVFPRGEVPESRCDTGNDFVRPTGDGWSVSRCASNCVSSSGRWWVPPPVQRHKWRCVEEAL